MTRLRAIATAAACALALVIATPGTASAEAIGDLHYTYTDAQGTEQREKLSDPDLPSSECLDVKQAQGDDTKPAHSPYNNTDTTVWIFPDRDCEGDRTILKAGAKGGVNLKFRSFYYHHS
ncbi:hypothetical protein [Streptomyces syringium]|uniref:Uncharacterized protein n=1 Tax=Streptomyces syringium TaxID=76729 RepID=A0ABS4Y5P2_9ACTN|nr:hypothetical protein [Streptomyces syringium]MBP2404101.1 hypothetical protein [Streptomyces syringium]